MIFVSKYEIILLKIRQDFKAKNVNSFFLSHTHLPPLLLSPNFSFVCNYYFITFLLFHI